MADVIDRRCFVRVAGASALGIGYAGLRADLWAADETAKGKPHARKLGWRLACAAWSFNKFSFQKTIDTVAELGLDSVEGFSWQPLSEQKPAVQFNDSMSAADRKDIKSRLADKAVTLVGCYYNLPRADSCRKTFEWAKEMGMEYLVAEPPSDAYEILDRLCQEHRIKLAIHGHAKPNPNWNPEVLMIRLQGRSPWMGLCCDTGHWVRSGLDPVEMLKKVQGRIVNFHLKDIAAADSAESLCVPFGTGKGNIEGILGEARRQSFRGVFAIEYEPCTPENFARVAECIAAFERMAAQLEKSPG